MPTHRLAAILFADIVGYTAMMQTDEAAGIARASLLRKAMEDLLPAHEGQLVEMRGDGALCLFDSSTEAVRCAVKIQQRIRKEVPLRMGLHLGDITEREGHLFGDAVNIASRIESMGVAGAVLISSNIRQQIKNKSEFELESLGKVAFKNVTEPMTVYALANEGLVVPKHGEMKGKGTKAYNPRSLIRLASIGFIAMAVGAAIFWAVGLTSSNKSESLTEEEREKRVAVLAFENKTGEEGLEDYGLMISDWITKGLMETGEANVVSASNIQVQIERAGLNFGVANPEFADATGVDILLQGRYYLQNGDIIIQSQIVEVTTGKILHALDAIEGSRDQMRTMLEQLTQKALGYWAVRDLARFAQNPPDYEAFQAYQSGKILIPSREEAPKAIQYLTKAYKLDTTFFAPLLRLSDFYYPLGRTESRDSLYEVLNEKRMYMTKWEQLKVEGIMAIKEENYLKAARLAERRFQMDPSSGEANYTSGRQYFSANYLNKAREILEAFDTRFLNPDSKFGVRPRVMASLYFQFEEYEKAVKVAETYRYEVRDGELAYYHLESLVRLQQWEELKQQVLRYRQMDEIRWFDEKEMFQRLCSQLYLMDSREKLEEYVAELLRSHTDNLSMGIGAFFLGEYPKAITHLEQVRNDSSQPKGQRSYASVLLAKCFAKIGEPTRIPSLEALLMDLELHPANLNYSMAALKAAMGEEEAAIHLLEKSIDEGLRLDWVHPDKSIYFEPLFDKPDFQNLLKPKG